MDGLPEVVAEQIVSYLGKKELLRCPPLPGLSISDIEFPIRYPIRKDDARQFSGWMRRRRAVLDQSLTTLEIHNYAGFMSHPEFIDTIGCLLECPRVRSVILHDFRPTVMVWEAVPVALQLVLRTALGRPRRRWTHLRLDVPFLMHLNPTSQCGTIHLSFRWSYYASASSSSWVGVSAKTSAFGLRTYLRRLRSSTGHVQRLVISTLTTDYIFKDFPFLFDTAWVHPDRIASIHFQGFMYGRNPIEMIWVENGIRYSLQTCNDIKDYPRAAAAQNKT